MTYRAVLHVQRLHSQQRSRARVRALAVKDPVHGCETATSLAKAHGCCISDSVALQEARTDEHDDLKKCGRRGGTHERSSVSRQPGRRKVKDRNKKKWPEKRQIQGDERFVSSSSSKVTSLNPLHTHDHLFVCLPHSCMQCVLQVWSKCAAGESKGQRPCAREE